MIYNYLKIALRRLRRDARYMVINVLGLGVALAFCILSFTNYRYAHSFDQWHSGSDKIFRVEVYKSSNHILHGTCPASLTPIATSHIPGIEAATRIDSRGLTIKRGENVFNQQVHFVDDNFLDFFQFPLVSGQAKLSDHSSLLITAEMAEKFFGDENPIGQQLLLYADAKIPNPLIITGVMKDCPKNSSIRFDFLTHLDNQMQADTAVVYDSWSWFVDAAFIRLKNPADVPAVEAALQTYTAPQNLASPNWMVERYRLEALPQMALNSRNIRWNNLGGGIPPAAIWGNITVALMLLLTACLNFANTTIAAGNRRLREMGVRKVMGGTQGQLMRQLLSEAFLICLAALGLGMTLVIPMAEWYNATWKHLELKISYADNFPLLLFLGTVVVGTTLMAGAYPAFYISAFNPSNIFRGSLRFGGASVFSRLMMGAQVAISLAALVVGFSFAKNAQMQRSADAGYDRESLIGVELPDVESYRAFRNAVVQLPAADKIAGTRHHVGFNYRRTEFDFSGKHDETLLLDAGKNYLSLVDIRRKSGVMLENLSDATGNTGVLVNETFVREFAGGQDIIGQTLRFDTITYQIAGVVQDFMIDSPFDPMSPVVVRLIPEEQYRYCVVKAKPENLNALYANLEKTWKKLFPYKPFTGFYQSEVVAEALEVSENIATTMFIFSITILLLTISGLFAIVSLNALKQFRALAIRRVLGASAGQISYQLNRNFLLVVIGSLIVGSLMGRIFALAMLNSIYKIHSGVPAFVLFISAVCLLIVMMATAGLKVWQIWKMNVPEALKAE